MIKEAAEILLVEDSPDDVAFFVHTLDALERKGLAARLQVIQDGAAALDFIFCTGRYAHRKPVCQPKVVILDLKLPKLNGLEVLRRMKSDLRTLTIPVVILSSSQEERDLIESYKSGANSYLVKPMDFDEFSKTIGALIQYWLQFNHTLKL